MLSGLRETCSVQRENPDAAVPGGGPLCGKSIWRYEMALVKWDPWNDMARLRRELDSFFGERSTEWMPAADVTREADKITMQIDLPGMTADDVKIELRDSQLVVTGERKEEKEETHEGTVSRERFFGSFVRSLQLPPGVSPDDVNAAFAHGELTVTVALPTAVVAKQIEIQTPEPASV
jgi:HSP20 family protein